MVEGLGLLYGSYSEIVVLGRTRWVLEFIEFEVHVWGVGIG